MSDPALISKLGEPACGRDCYKTRCYTNKYEMGADYNSNVGVRLVLFEHGGYHARVSMGVSDFSATIPQ